MRELSIPTLHVNVAKAKHELDLARSSGDELAAALAEDRLNATLDALSARLAKRAARRPSKAPAGA